jgi:hypothetical protein
MLPDNCNFELAPKSVVLVPRLRRLRQSRSRSQILHRPYQFIPDLIFNGNALIIVSETRYGDGREHLEVLGVTNLLARLDVDKAVVGLSSACACPGDHPCARPPFGRAIGSQTGQTAQEDT